MSGYSEAARARVRELQAEGRLGEILRARYPALHTLRSDRALYGFIARSRQERLRNAAPIDRVVYDAKLHPARHALGMHTPAAAATADRPRRGTTSASRRCSATRRPNSCG